MTTIIHTIYTDLSLQRTRNSSLMSLLISPSTRGWVGTQGRECVDKTLPSTSEITINSCDPRMITLSYIGGIIENIVNRLERKPYAKIPDLIYRPPASSMHPGENVLNFNFED